MKKVLGGTGAAIALKLALGVVAAAAAITVAGAATEIATTGSLNPTNWGQAVTHQVQVCKDTLRASGTRGIGQCVSAFAKTHGQTVSAEHRASNARTNGHGNGNANANSHGKNKGNANGHGNGSGGSGGGTPPNPLPNPNPKATVPPQQP